MKSVLVLVKFTPRMELFARRIRSGKAVVLSAGWELIVGTRAFVDKSF
jgi:hypothetical protein